MKQNKKYWLYQLSGWSIYSILSFLFSLNPDNPLSFRISVTIVIFVMQIGLTHLYRKLIWYFKWLEQPIKNNVIGVLAASVLLGCFVESIVIIIYYYFSPADLHNTSSSDQVISYINRSFVNFAWATVYFAYHYFDSSNAAKIEKLKYEMLLKDAELKLLKSQINPHFMFNAINGISGLINENPANAQTALSQLSSLLRYSLNANKNETVALEEELQIVSDYLALESIRFEERLKVKFEIDPGTLNYQIPPMMIQTLCENGIKHGISKLQNGGELIIRSETDNDSLKLSVLSSGSLNTEDGMKAGTGLENTKQRLHLLYGNAAGFSLKTGSGEFVTAEIVIPRMRTYESINS